MQTFLNWIKEQKLDSTLISTDAPAPEKTDVEATPATVEDRKRTGYSANYPPAYVSAQYPQKYFNPSKATADLDAQNMKKSK
jgi:hypothetical protein